MNRDVKICIFLVWLQCFLGSAYLHAVEASLIDEAGVIRLTDSYGSQFVIDKPFERVVSLDSGIVEIIFELGAEDRLVGRSRFADYPEAVSEIENVGGLVDPNLEIIAKIAPDLVFVSRMGLSSLLLERFAALEIPAIVFSIWRPLMNSCFTQTLSLAYSEFQIALGLFWKIGSDNSVL